MLRKIKCKLGMHVFVESLHLKDSVPRKYENIDSYPKNFRDIYEYRRRCIFCDKVVVEDYKKPKE